MARQILTVTLAFILTLGLTLGNPTMAAKPPAEIPPGAFNFRPMNEEERNSAMCVAGATTGMIASYLAGPSEVIMLVVGGLVVPSSSSILFWGLFGTIAAAGCTIGSLVTPATSWLYNQL